MSMEHGQLIVPQGRTSRQAFAGKAENSAHVEKVGVDEGCATRAEPPS
jgi:hypothetical protein